MCMEPIATMTLPEWYKATVNESETITEAQTILSGSAVVAAKPASCGPPVPGFRPRPTSNGAELGSVRNVGLRYGLGPEILRDLSFLIPAHSFQFLTGPSGAGKTSLLRLLFLSLRPTRGLVNLFGHDVLDARQR